MDSSFIELSVMAVYTKGTKDAKKSNPILNFVPDDVDVLFLGRFPTRLTI